MRQTQSILLLAACLFAPVAGCQKAAPTMKYATPLVVSTGAVTFPELGASQTIQPGIAFQEATLQRAGVPMKVWIYRSADAKGKLPLVLVPPAGSTLFVGMGLADGDRAEHYPYARAGFVVVSFEIDGHVPNLQNASDASLTTAARAFEKSQAGMANAKAALDFALAKVPDVDAERVFIAGHSSAATLALLYASHEPRIKRCVAYAPCTDVEDRLSGALPSLNSAMPGFDGFIRNSSPRSHLTELTCPVFLFHALDDDNLPALQTKTFADDLKKTNPQVTLVTTPNGGHYQSMIDQGIPQGIEWLKSQPAERK